MFASLTYVNQLELTGKSQEKKKSILKVMNIRWFTKSPNDYLFVSFLYF